MSDDTQPHVSGPISWMASHGVAANLLMLVLLVGGAIMALQVKQEVFPEFTLDLVTISVPYPGASPAEVEEGIILAIEGEVRGIDGVKEVRSVAREGQASVTVELFSGANRDRVLNDVKSSVDRITSFPEDAEEPIISLASNRREVISLILYGDVTRGTLKNMSEEIRDELLTQGDITLVEVEGLPPVEISVEVPQAALRRHGLTLPGLAQQLDAASIELPAGDLETPGGEVLVRTRARRKQGDAYEDVPVIQTPSGSRVTLSALGEVNDTFRDTKQAAFYNGQPAVRLRVFRVGDQTPIEIAEAVKAYVEDKSATLNIDRAETTIERQDGRRILAVTADVDPTVTTGGEVLAGLETEHLPALQARFPGLDYQYGGEQEEQAETFAALRTGGLIALLIMYALLAVSFQSYVQPLLVLIAIPFGVVGAIGGHLVMGYDLSIISVLGIVALSGVVVNDSLVLIAAVNTMRRDDGMPLRDAVVEASARRFRPILLTSLTTFLGLAPMIFETSVQARFLIPMAISLGFGVLFVTVIALIIVPALYMMFEDLGRARQWVIDLYQTPSSSTGEEEPA